MYAFYPDWLFICIVSPSEAVIEQTEVINGIRIYGNEAFMKGKREKFIVDIICLKRENKTGTLFLYIFVIYCCWSHWLCKCSLV